MADYTDKKLPDAEVPLRVAATTRLSHSITMISDIVGTLTEFIEFFDLPKGVRLVDSALRTNGALAATGTMKLVAGSTDLTATATTGAASNVRTTLAPILLATATTVKVQLATNNTANATTVMTVDVAYEHGDFGISA
jgi:hypothetical protein